MDTLTKISWTFIALIHLMPAAVFFRPDLSDALYGAPPTRDIGILLVHRGALFLAVFAAAVYAIFDPSARKLSVIVAAISMIGFLWIYARAGMPSGALRKIAIADAVGILALLWASYQAWLR